MSTTLYTGAEPLRRVIPFPAAKLARQGPSAALIDAFEAAYGAAERASDLCAVVVAVRLAWFAGAAWQSDGIEDPPGAAVWVGAVCLGILVVLLLEKYGDYRRSTGRVAVRNTERLLRVTLSGVAPALIAAAVWAKDIPKASLAAAAVLIPVALAMEKQVVQRLAGMMRRTTERARMALAAHQAPAPRYWYEKAKRALDMGVALPSLLVVSPILAGAAMAVKLSSPGPVIFRQRRVGRNGRLFEMLKFRTLFADSEAYARSPVSGRDPRITRVGRFLRHSCIDELPQLINVLRGEMSLVGPRPEMPHIVAGYTQQQRARLAVKPGITGLWQLSGDRLAPIHENLSHDLYYIRHRSVWMDVAILMHTVVFAFRGV
jgi:lipopolysaccharide/colanic/teichoic acid biosynthesis glycosyltransferase